MFQVFADSGVITIKVLEALDLDSVPRLRSVVDAACEDNRLLGLCIDLLAYPYLNSTAIAFFITLWKKRGDALEVHVPSNGAVHKAFEVCGLLSQKFVRVIY